MANLQWNSVLPNFSGSNAAMANAQRGIAQATAAADSIVDNFRRDEELKLREDELGMRKTEHQMKLDARDELLKEKTAANNYASGLSSVLSGGVVGVEDQKNLGDLMNSEAARIRATSPQATDAEVAAKMDDYQKSVLPTMVSKFDKSPEEQLKALRGTNPLGGLSAIAPQTRVALLKEAEAPLEKTMDRQLDFGNQQLLNKEKYANDLKLLNKREEIDQANWLKRTEWQQNRDDAKALLHATATKKAEDQKKYDQALGLQESLVSMLSTDESPEAKKDLARVKNVVADLDTPKTDMSKMGPDGKPKMFVLPVDAKLDAVKKLYNEIEDKQKIRREDTKELKKDKEDAVTGYSAAAVGSLDQSDVISDMVKDLDPKQGSILKAKYGTTEDAGAFMSDLYDKIPTNLRTELKSILKAKDDDTFLFTSKEDLLGKFVQKPEVRKALLGEAARAPKKVRNDDSIFGAD